jgi:hypothetical protein
MNVVIRQTAHPEVQYPSYACKIGSRHKVVRNQKSEIGLRFCGAQSGIHSQGATYVE